MDPAQTDETVPTASSNTPASSDSPPSAPSLTPATSGGAYYKPVDHAHDPVPSAPATSEAPAPTPLEPTPPTPLPNTAPAASTPLPAAPTSGPAPSLPNTVFESTPTAVPPSTPPPSTPDAVVERMQAANNPKGKKGSKVLLLVVGIVFALLLAGVGYWLWQSREESVGIPVTTEEFGSEPEEETLTLEQEREGTLATARTSELITDETPNTAEVYGLVCSYADEHPAGAVLFYNPENENIYRQPLAEGKNIYSIKVPAGEYMAFFEPLDKNLPIFAFTQYVLCGLDPNACTDHSMAIMRVEANAEYGQVDLCDPQYLQDGLPEELQYENS